MSTLKMQESVPDSELTQLRRQATHKDIRYATLENELLKRNNDLLAVQNTLDDTLYKLRNEADRAVELEADLKRRSEDLRAERLARQNLEASLNSASERLKSEELTSKHLQLELETYASRTASKHQDDLKRLQQEKTILETRVCTLEAQSQANKPSQLPTRLPRPTTFSGAASTVSDARIATLESELSRAQRELIDVSQALTSAQQDAAKLPHLQSKLIAAENAQLRAERLVNVEKTRADSIQEVLREREEELEYWQNMAGDRSAIEEKIERLEKERDDAIKREGEILWRETGMRKRLDQIEEREAELVMEREDALDALHRVQTETSSNSNAKAVGDGRTIEDLQAALAERDAALLNARGYVSELQQMYRDTLGACDAAEARVRDLEQEHTNSKGEELPLIIVSPPPSPSPTAPFLAQAQPAITMSAADEAVVARLLNAIERLRSERDALRRDVHFAQVEHRMTADALQARLSAAESELHLSAMDSRTRQDEVRARNDSGMQKLKDDLQHWQRNVSEADDALVMRTAELEACKTELDSVRVKVRTLEDSTERITALHVKDARIALSSLIVVGHLQSKVDEAEVSKETLWQKCNNLTERHNQMMEASLLEAVQTTDVSFSTQESLRKELAIAHTRLSDALHVTQDRDSQIVNMQARLSELQTSNSTLGQELAQTRIELKATETRHSEHQLSALASADVGAASALKAQLEVLEQRVLRRTEQIGMQQHDIKRLETNLRVAEDTIGELNVEVETLGRERECLVEDCAQAREARDEAHRRVESLEVEIETFAREHEQLAELKDTLRDAKAEFAASERRVEVLVHIVIDSASRSRALGADLALTAARLSSVEEGFYAAEARHSEARIEIEGLTSELESNALMLSAKTADVETITHELSLAKDETQRLSSNFEYFKKDVQSREDVSSHISNLTNTVQDLEDRLATAQTSEGALLEELEAAKRAETALGSQLRQVQEDSRAVTADMERLSLTVTSLEEAIEAGRSSHYQDLERAQREFEARLTELEAQLEERQIQCVTLETNHTQAIQDFIAKNEDLHTRLTEVREDATSRESLEGDLRRLMDEHAEEILVFRSRLDESVGQIEALQTQLKAATSAIQEYESDMEISLQRYDAVQVEKRGLEHALAGARTQLNEHDTSIRALQREKTLLQGEHTRLEAELEKSVTKFQYLEQHSRRSDQDIMNLKVEVDRLRAEAAKFDEAAQKAEVSLSFKTVQFEQKMAMMQRDMKKQQEHRHCQEIIAELKEKTEYLEEMLRMKSVEIEENDDRFIEALKEKKRLNGKIESMTRKVQSLQTKLAATTAQPLPTTPVALPIPRPKTPPPPVPVSMPSIGPSVRLATRIPSSPAAALRAKTPDPLRGQFASRFATPEPPVPTLPPAFKPKTPEGQTSRTASRVEQYRGTQAIASGSRVMPTDAPSTPLSSGSRKRRAPDDFDSPAPIPAEAVVAPNVNLTPRHLRRPTNEGRSGFTPTRNGNAPPPQPALSQPSPLRRVTAPLSEMTNSPRGARVLGLGKPVAVSKPPMRSWLSRSRPPTRGVDVGSTSALDVRP